jgi:hypothetical protein
MIKNNQVPYNPKVKKIFCVLSVFFFVFVVS